jgi:uncharacterized protein YcbX
MFISEINVYPIKSLRGISLQKSVVEDKGLRFDRRWMLVDKNNRFLTQREFPRLATLAVDIADDKLRVSNGENNIEISLSPAFETSAAVKIWSSRVRANIYEREINEWFSGALQINCKLAVMPEDSKRKVNYFYAVHKEDVVSFADAYPFLLIGENSLKDLNERLDKKIPMNRFRPNFVVAGSEAFEEDVWKRIKIGATLFHLVKPCARCVVTTIDQRSGISDGKEPLKTLATYRISKRSVNKKILFGQNLIAETVGAEIKVGDRVEIIERKN